jgi:glutaminyl-tRNA synthetase
MAFLADLGGDAPLDGAALDAAAGVGVVVTPEQVTAAVESAVAAHRDELVETRYRFPVGNLIRAVGASLPWADARAVKDACDAAIVALLGPKTDADAGGARPPSKKPVAAGAAGAPKKPAEAGASAARAASGDHAEPPPPTDPFAFFPDPAANNRVHTTVPLSTGGEPLRIANTPAQLAAHLAATGGAVITRFPPEPNGYLHLGHAKACFIDFGLAVARGGKCYLRFDDTNPAAEKVEFIEHIKEIVAWLGWSPAAVTHSSDYFSELHAIAVKLIESGHAYVCHQSPSEVKASRDARVGSPWRDRPVEESLRAFSDMTRGAVPEGAATLRLKQDPGNDNFNMFDLIAYRVKFTPHPHSGSAWCVYPSYDFTHCLVDALENVTHSLCTLEFEPRRASYYWLLEVAGLYKPVVWEYGRLVLHHNVLSKRKLTELVSKGHVAGWDDPRLLTLAGLRRRGVPARAINAFCREVGITRSDAAVGPALLDAHIRAALDDAAPRVLAVLDPVRLVLTNWPEGRVEAVPCRLWPNRAAGADGSHDTYDAPLSRTLHIEAADFRPVDEKGYFGLAPGKAALLKYAGVVTCTGFTAGPDGRVEEIQATYEPLAPGAKPPKGVLSWVGETAPGTPPCTFEARLYGLLFKSADPAALGPAWLSDLDRDSARVVRGALAARLLAGTGPESVYQIERVGYFAVDPGTTPGALVLNRTVTLKESVATRGVRGK